MKADPLLRTLLFLTTIFLGLIVLKPLVSSQRVQAASEVSHRFYIEPGTTQLTSPDGRQNVIGKVVVDLTNGNVWGFPTNWPKPYPTTTIAGKPPVVAPIYLGRFDLDATIR